jgi:hypothetical protein
MNRLLYLELAFIKSYIYIYIYIFLSRFKDEVCLLSVPFLLNEKSVVNYFLQTRKRHITSKSLD